MENIEEIIVDSTFLKATLSKPRQKTKDLQNVYFVKKTDAAEDYVHVTYRYKTKDQVQNFSLFESAKHMEHLLINDFFFADFYLENQQITLRQSKKGKVTWSRKEIVSLKSTSTKHNKEKNRLIPENASFLQALGLASNQGRIYQPAQKKYKQINRYVELISHLIGEEDIQKLSIADMGSGKGYLTFALYDYLQRQGIQVEAIGVEMRPDLIEKCNTIAKEGGMSKLSFVKGNIQETEIGNKDMVIALHACDIATDMAIAKALEADAKYIVVAPCCHKQIRKDMQIVGSLKPMLKHGILLERQAEMLTDSIRALILEAKGYKTQVFEFISSEHTGKNVMITAVNTGIKNLKALDQIRDLKKLFGINEHYLESLV